MDKSSTANDQHSQPELYEIRIQGHLHKRREGLFEGLNITRCPDGTTIFVGPLQDQTALHSILLRIRNMNLKLISVNHVEINPGTRNGEFIARKETDLNGLND